MPLEQYRIPVEPGLSSKDFEFGRNGLNNAPRPILTIGHDPNLEGFMVDEEAEIIKISAPTENDQFAFQCKGSTAKVPDVVYYNVDQIDNQAEPPSHNLYTFRAVKQVNGEPVTDEAFIYTGSNESKSHPCVRKEVFIPLEQLKERLVGHPYSRLMAYQLDWLTYCARRDITELPGAWGENYTPAREQLTAWDGRHLLVRDNLGVRRDSAEFLKHLLTPSQNDRDHNIKNIPLYIFQRWAHVAYVAGIAPKPPFSVMARFYHLPALSNITFHCAMTPTFVDKIREHDPNLIEADISKAWVDRMNHAISALKNRATTAPNDKRLKIVLPELKTWNWEDGEAENATDMQLLGRHPEGYYCVYVSKDDFRNMKAQGFKTKDRGFPVAPRWPNGNDRYSIYGTGTIKSTDPEKLTTTVIESKRIDVASITPRYPSQLSVMDHVSATDVGVRIFDERISRAYEWLHRSAYSYGGLEGKSPDSSQTKENIVFGTFEANTSMIRTEEYLKRLAKQRKCKVVLTTTLLHHPDWPAQERFSWLVPNLEYAWKFVFDGLPESPKNLSKGLRTFSLTSQRIPTRVEVELDVEVENAWWNHEDQTFHHAYLRSKHNQSVPL